MSEGRGEITSTTLLMDGHVHYHACFDLEVFLGAAARNFEAARRAMGRPEAVGCLMLTENSWNHWFQALSEGLLTRLTSEWDAESTGESCSLLARKGDGTTLVVVAGRQVVAADRLEVLALATTQEFPDGLPFRATLEAVLDSGAIAVLPWGFGKWTGARGRLVADLLSSPDADLFYLGDNGGRPEHTPSPGLFGVALKRGVPILPGSDPLPLRAEVHKPGRYGFVLEGPFDPERPAASIRSLLSNRTQPQRFGHLESPGTFVLRQAQLRLRRPRRQLGSTTEGTIQARLP
jgi:hypothetical protein